MTPIPSLPAQPGTGVIDIILPLLRLYPTDIPHTPQIQPQTAATQPPAVEDSHPTNERQPHGSTCVPNLITVWEEEISTSLVNQTIKRTD